MKRILTVLVLMMVLIGMSGCSTMKSYKDEDLEVYEIISELDEIKKNAEEDGVEFDYEVKKGLNEKYTIKISFKFDDHKFDLKSIGFKIDEIDELSDLEADDIFTFKVDGKKYDYETTWLLLDHYLEIYYENRGE